MPEETQKTVPRGLWRRPWVRVCLAALTALALCFGLAAVYIARHAQPILKQSVVETLAEHFHSPVQLDRLDISLLRGVEVRGQGLRIQYLGGAQPDAVSYTPPGTPMLSVKQFSFHTSLAELLHRRANIAQVEVDGLVLYVPPDRHGLMPNPDGSKPRISLTVSKIHCTNVTLIIETTKPGKEPLQFDIQNLELTDVGGGSAMLYDADVINPKPVGKVHAFGHFGPWQGANPRSTPIDGIYTFADADLSTIHGIGGILSSTGEFAGELGRITIDGSTETPDFSLDVSDHPVPLETSFHAYVDGTTGDTTLAPVQATLLHSEFTATGTVVRVKGQGHDIALKIDMPHGHIEDLLQLGMKTEPPVMRGVVTMKATLHIPPGKQRVAQKLELAGQLHIANVELSNPKWQDRVDGLSMRAQGMPRDAKSAGSDGKAQVAAQMAIDFSLGKALVTVNSLQYQIPGAQVNMDGIYSMDGNVFEFKGHVRTDATVSHMVTGWRSALLKPFDPLFKRDGAGLQLPVAISGTKDDLHFGLALHNADESPGEMADEMKAKRQAQSAH